MTQTLTTEQLREIMCVYGNTHPCYLAAAECLANREAQPVIVVGDDGGDALAYRRLIQSFLPGTKLYTAPPAPAVPEEVSSAIRHLKDTLVACNRFNYCADAVNRVEDACRAAMLNHSGDANEKAETKCECSSLDYCENCLRGMMAQPVSQGYKLVPVEPTEDMIAAAMNCDDVEFNSDETFCVNFDNIYRAMLAAAPEGGNDA